MRWTIGAVTLAMTAGCAGPNDPTYADPNAIGPPLAVGDDCDPPFPMNFAQDWFVMADLDRGIACNVFVEQDECAIGVYHDCTDAKSANPREWQGFVGADPDVMNDYEPSITMVVKRDGSGGRLPREPACCRGGLYPRVGDMSPTYAMLTCHKNSCETKFDLEHTGLFIELANGFDPRTLDRGEVTLRSGARASDAVYAAGAVWVVVDGSVYRVNPATSTAMDVGVTIAGAQHIAAAPGGAAIYVAGTELVRIATNNVDPVVRAALTGPADAIAVTTAGVLVAVSAGATSTLHLFDLATLAPRDAPRTQAERITSLAALDSAEAIAAATAEASASIFSVTSTLTMAVLKDLMRDDALSPGAVIPGEATQIEAQVIGFLAACYADAAPKRHCYYELDVAAAQLSRVGIPDVEQLAGIAYDVVTDRVVLSSAGGRVAFVDRGPPFRPRVQETVHLEGSLLLGAVAVDPDDATAYVVHPNDGAVGIVAEPVLSR